MSRRYVDNAQNRRLGRVGQSYGSGSSSTTSRSTTSSVSSMRSSSTSQPGCYVDNAYNRESGRAGKQYGTHVVHRSGQITITGGDGGTSSSRSATGCYVDNKKNRDLGRAGKPYGTHVVHKSGDVTISDGGTSSSRSATGYYVDNKQNRELGRAGKPYGTCVAHKSGEVTTSDGGTSGSRSTASPGGPKCYVDNAYNRRLGRVGKPLGSHVVRGKSRKCQELVSEYTLQDLIEIVRNLGLSDSGRPNYEYAVEVLERETTEESWRRAGVQPSTDLSRLVTHTPGEIIPYKELEFLDKTPIGRGSFGEVFAGKWRGTPVAFKKLLYQHMSRKLHSTFIKEVSILSTLSHPSIVRMFGAVVEVNNVGIVMEYMLRSLHRAIHWDEGHFSPAKKKEMVDQISSALEYLHTRERKIAHCDIKSNNILLDRNSNAKLSDFGISAIKNAAETTQSSARGAAPPGQGTPRYSAPEVLRGEILSISQLLQTDIYSLAVVVFELLAEEEPFYHLNLRQLEANVGRGTMRPTTSNVKLSKQVENILQRCWDGCATKRPSVTEFCEDWGKITVLCEDPK